MDYMVGVLVFVAVVAAEMAWHARKDAADARGAARGGRDASGP